MKMRAFKKIYTFWYFLNLLRLINYIDTKAVGTKSNLRYVLIHLVYVEENFLNRVGLIPYVYNVTYYNAAG